MPKESNCQKSFCQTATSLVYYLILLILFWMLLRLLALSLPLRHVRNFLTSLWIKWIMLGLIYHPLLLTLRSLFSALLLFTSLSLWVSPLYETDGHLEPSGSHTDVGPSRFFKEVIWVLGTSVLAVINCGLSCCNSATTNPASGLFQRVLFFQNFWRKNVYRHLNILLPLSCIFRNHKSISIVM